MVLNVSLPFSARVIRAYLIHLQERPDCVEAGPAAVPHLTRQHGQALLGPAWPTCRAGEATYGHRVVLFLDIKYYLGVALWQQHGQALLGPARPACRAGEGHP
jgi:hypothetical protein